MRAELYRGDCLELIKTLPDGSVDMVLNWAEIWSELRRVCKTNAAKLFFACNAFTIDLCASNRKEYRYRYTWVKPTATNVFNSKRMPLRQCEEVAVFYQKQPTYNPQMREGPAYNQKPLICRQSIFGKVSLSEMLKQLDFTQLSENSRANLSAVLAEHGLTLEDAAQLNSIQVSGFQYTPRRG